ncbi:MAG: hypothetical protein PHR94_13810 [Methylomonas lenta]|nr:hypothetical protein [Methylomonas lenta]
MKKIIVAVLLVSITRVEAQGMAEAMKPLYACEQVVIRENAFLENYKAELWPLISDDCSKQMKAAQIACGVEINQNADACVDIINDKLEQYYLDIVNSKTEDD